MSEERDLVQRLKEKLAEASEFIKAVTHPPFVYGSVVRLNEDSVDVSVDGRTMEVSFAPKYREKLVPGRGVRLNPETMAVVDTRVTRQDGLYTTVEEILDDGRVVINEGGGKHVLNIDGKAKKGDRIVVDKGFNIVLQNLGKESKQFHIEEVPQVPWSRIGGLESTIELLRESVEDPFVNREIYERYGKRPPKGVLLYGPPGCGKTLLAKAVAYNLTERMKAEGRGNGNGYFLSVKGPELLDKWVGESERGIRDLFARARESSKSRDDVTVLFMDEAESLLKTRGSGISSDVYDSIVPQFLSEMDGMNGNDGLVLILATNRADIIDPAVLRPGRVDRKIRIGRPNPEAAEQIFGIHLENMPIYRGRNGESTIALAKYATQELFSEEYPLFEVSFGNGCKDFVYLGNLTSGAMIESIAQRAAGRAIKREIGGGKKGLVREDLAESVRAEYGESRELTHLDRDELRARFSDNYEKITAVNRTYGGRNGN